MTETKRASEMEMEQIESILENMDWTEIHKARVFSDYGASIVLYTDGEFSVQDQSTYYRDPDAAGVIGYLSCWGQGNVDRTVYYEGYWTLTDALTNEPYMDPEGRLYTEDQMLVEAIEEGDWDYTEEIDAVLENVKRDREEVARA